MNTPRYLRGLTTPEQEAGTVRLLLMAPPRSDVATPHLIANASGTVQ